MAKLGDEVFVVIVRDRHSDDGISIHTTREGADGKVEEAKKMFDGYSSEPIGWKERDYGRGQGWLRYVESHDDGPSIIIESQRLQK